LEMGVLWTICQGCPWNSILQISASQVVRIAGMSHGCLTVYIYIYIFFFWYKFSLTLPGLALNLWSSCLWLSSSCDYRYAPTCMLWRLSLNKYLKASAYVLLQRLYYTNIWVWNIKTTSLNFHTFL
jgi:hypothetical protein